MKCRYTLAVLLCAALVAFAGCGDNSNGGSGGGGGGNNGSGSVTYQQFKTQALDKFAKVMCSGVYDCPEKQSPAYVMFAGRFADKQACIAGVADALHIQVSDPEADAAVQAGRVTFNADKASACLAAIDQMMASCPSLSDMQNIDTLGACAEVTTPQQAEGEPCNNNDECVGGLCEFSSGGECYGTCTTAPSPAQEGDSCDSATCADGLVCAPDASGNSSTCIQPGSRAEGEGCEFGTGACQDGLVCGLAGTCMQAASYVDSGATCNFTDAPCKAGLVCSDMHASGQNYEGTCSAPLGQGGSCQTTYQCQVGMYCKMGSAGSGTCETLKDNGASCEAGSECSSGTCGQDGTCAAPGGNVCEIPASSNG